MAGVRGAWATAGLALLLLATALASCGRGSQDLPDVGVELMVSPDPPPVGPISVVVTLTDAAGRAIRGAAVELEGNMSHAGMVPVVEPAAEVAPGRYQAALELTMAGDWFVVVRADLPDGRSMERVVDLPGVGAE